MRLVKCESTTPDVTVTCSSCLALVLHSQAWADLDSPAFYAYYHEGCLPSPPEPDAAGPGIGWVAHGRRGVYTSYGGRRR